MPKLKVAHSGGAERAFEDSSVKRRSIGRAVLYLRRILSGPPAISKSNMVGIYSHDRARQAAFHGCIG
ncbi:hypothetical protein, partial [Halococcus hamelinensis]|uniref:hypothetical protein n=1 Tax=Halococcus hamelinensis TaxID=332168 RepID=UPI001ED9079B